MPFAVWCDREETEILRGDELASHGFLVDRAAVAVFECRYALHVPHMRPLAPLFRTAKSMLTGQQVHT